MMNGPGPANRPAIRKSPLVEAAWTLDSVPATSPERQASIAGFDLEEVFELPAVDVADSHVFAVRSMQADLAATDANGQQAFGPDPVFQGKTGGNGHRSVLPSARIAVAASSALMSWRASASSTSARPRGAD